MFKTLTIEGSESLNEEAKVWVKFLKSRLMSTIHTTTASQDRLLLLYVIVKWLKIDVGKVIEREIRDCAT